MKNSFLLVLLLLTNYQVTFSQSQETIIGRVINVKDGDSFDLVDAEDKIHKIRLAHVDCPEKKQAFGRKAQLYTFNFVFGKYVTAHVESIDRYYRKISVIEVDGKELNKHIIEDGYGWHFKKYSKSEAHATAELAARKKKSGLWMDETAKAPWEFRRRKPKTSIKQ